MATSSTWKDDLTTGKLDFLIPEFEGISLSTDLEISGLTGNTDEWDKLKKSFVERKLLKMLDQKRFETFKNTFNAKAAAVTHDMRMKKQELEESAKSPGGGENSPIRRLTTPVDDDNYDNGKDEPVYPEDTANYETVVRQIKLIKDDLATIASLLADSSLTSYVRNGMTASRALLMESFDRCKARKSSLEGRGMTSGDMATTGPPTWRPRGSRHRVTFPGLDPISEMTSGHTKPGKCHIFAVSFDIYSSCVIDEAILQYAIVLRDPCIFCAIRSENICSCSCICLL